MLNMTTLIILAIVPSEIWSDTRFILSWKCDIKNVNPDDVIGFSGGKVYYCNIRCIENFNVFTVVNVVKASIYVVHQNSRVSFICIYIIYNKVHAYHWLASISIDWKQRKFEIIVSMPRPFKTNLYEGTCRLFGYLFYLYSTKDMKIKAAVTIR